jgi:hypothetical protein
MAGLIYKAKMKDAAVASMVDSATRIAKVFGDAPDADFFPERRFRDRELMQIHTLDTVAKFLAFVADKLAPVSEVKFPITIPDPDEPTAFTGTPEGTTTPDAELIATYLAAREAEEKVSTPKRTPRARKTEDK